MNLDKYKTNGWGLSKTALEYLNQIIQYNRIKRIIEFGSGKSTEFLCDAQKEYNLELHITSFDNDEKYCYTPKKDDSCNVLIRELGESTDNLLKR